MKRALERMGLRVIGESKESSARRRSGAITQGDYREHVTGGAARDTVRTASLSLISPTHRPSITAPQFSPRGRSLTAVSRGLAAASAGARSGAIAVSTSLNLNHGNLRRAKPSTTGRRLSKWSFGSAGELSALSDVTVGEKKGTCCLLSTLVRDCV